MAITIRRARSEDHDRLFHLARQAFPIQESDRADDFKRFKPERTAVIETDGRIVAKAVAHPMGHWFGGRVVDSVGIAGVAVSPEARGKGYGTRLCRFLLDEAAANGTPISALFPATIPIYRSLGYGDAFHRTAFKAPLAALPRRGGSSDVEIREMTEDDVPLVIDTYHRFGAASGGLATRDAEWWRERVLTSQSPFRYLAFEDDVLTGWLIYGFVKPADDWRQNIHARDLVWMTRSSARALLSVAGLHRSTCNELHWIGPIDEPLFSTMHDHAIDLEDSFRAMLRVLDVPGALRARGYPSTVDVAFTLTVDDPHRPSNEGPWRIVIQKGSATVEFATALPEATVRVDGFASMFSGLLAARDAVRLGLLDGSSTVVDALEAAFAGPSPWLADFF